MTIRPTDFIADRVEPGPVIYSRQHPHKEHPIAVAQPGGRYAAGLKALCWPMLLYVLMSLPGCQEAQLIRPPEYDYASLADQFFKTRLKEHFPLTVQRGANLHPVSTQNGYLFFTANKSGSGDIWMRSLQNSISMPVIQHPAEQHQPALSAQGELLVYVSEDRDSEGDLMLTPLSPDDMVQNALRGLPPVNFWDDSINLSLAIEKLAQSLPAACQGTASEREPVLARDGRYLIFNSDRCQDGQSNIWLLELDADANPVQLRQVTTAGAYQASLGANQKQIYFMSRRDNYKGGRIYQLDLTEVLASGSSLPPSKDQARLIQLDYSRLRQLIAFPSVSSDGRFLIYHRIDQDSNYNGYLDLDDAGSVFKVALGRTPDGQIRTSKAQRLTGNPLGILSVIWSDFAGGSILYASRMFNHVNIYFVRADGIIPRQPGIEQQYQLTRVYLNQAPERYLLALDAVYDFFGEQDAWELYEGRVLLDRLDFFIKNGQGDQVDLTRRQLNEAARYNAYVQLEQDLLGQKTSRVIQLLKEFIDTQSRTNSGGTDTNMGILQAGAMFRLAGIHARQSNYSASLGLLTRLNQNRVNFFRRTEALLLEAEARSATSGRIDPLFVTLLNDAAIPPGMQDQVHAQVYRWFGRPAEKSARRQLLDQNQDRAGQHPLLLATWRLAKAALEFEEARAQNALALTDQILAAVPVEPYRNRTRPLLAWNGLFVRTWQLRERMAEARGDFGEAYFARISYGGSYYEGSSAELKVSVFERMVQESEDHIGTYVHSARELAGLAADHEELQISKGLLDKGLSVLEQDSVRISSNSLDVLQEFCQNGSRNNRLFFSLGGSHLKSYQDFCANQTKEAVSLPGATLALSRVKQASSLLYTVAYANASMLNLLFFNMNQSSIFSDLYRRKAYQIHKLKIDLAKEKQQIETERAQKRFFLPGQEEALQLLTESDPFLSETYDELAYGYDLTRAENVQVGDMSMWYGHAYLLVTRAMERERYYDQFQANGGQLSTEFLRKAKEEILIDLKNAEYFLKYIMNVDTRTTEAYLLLGWMYQYLDQRQDRVLPLESGYLEQLFAWATNTEQQVLDGLLYRDYYQAWFNIRFYEENVELYRQLLETRSKEQLGRQALAAVHLNLANNYFRLLSFSRAIEHYQELETLVAAAETDLFESYQQRALFYVNYGRANFFENRSATAAVLMQKAAQIYHVMELDPVQSRLKTLEFQLADQNADTYETNMLKLRREQLGRRLQATRSRLALIAALRGLALWDAGRYQESVIDYRQALDDLFGDDAIETSHGMNQAALLNFLAMARQGAGQYNQSIEVAAEAARLARDQQMIHPEERYLPNTIGGKMLGCILDYGEDFSVIGEGRNPYGFSPLRQYELSLGIRFQSLVLQGDLDGAAYILRQRGQVFGSLDAKRKQGQSGLIHVLNQSGAQAYQASDFTAAIESFGAARDKAFQTADIDGFRRNYQNMMHTAFARIEHQLYDRSQSGISPADQIADWLAESVEFRQQLREKIEQDYITDMQTEYPDYEYDAEAERGVIDQLMLQNASELREIELMLLFYQALLEKRHARNAADLQQAMASLRQTQLEYGRIVNAQVQSQSELRHPRQFRLKLNLARMALAAANYQGAMQIQREIAESSYEFNLITESFFASVLKAEILYDQSLYQPDQATAAEIAQSLLHARQILIDRPEVFDELRSRLEPFFQLAIEFFNARRDHQQTISFLELEWESRLQVEYFRYPLVFADQAVQVLYDQIRSKRRQLLQLDHDEAALRVARQSVNRIVQQKALLRVQIHTQTAALLETAPLHEPFVRPRSIASVEPLPVPTGKVALRYYYSAGRLHQWCLRGKSIQYRPLAWSQPNPALLAQAMQTCSSAYPKDQFFIIPDHFVDLKLYQQAWSAHDSRARRPLVFVNRGSDLFQGFVRTDTDIQSSYLNLFNVQQMRPATEAMQKPGDVQAVSIDLSQNRPLFIQGTNRPFDPRHWLTQEQFTALVYIDERNRPALALRQKMLYEFFRLNGTATVLYSNQDWSAMQPQLAASLGRTTLDTKQGIVFGAAGFNADQLHLTLKARSIARMLVGEALEHKGQYMQALRYYQLAESYQQAIDQTKTVLNFRNKLNLLRLQLKLMIDEDRDVLIETALASVPAQTVYQAPIYSTAANALTELADYEAARKYQQKYAQLLPDQVDRLEGDMQGIIFLQSLQATRGFGLPGRIGDLEQLFQRLLPDFIRQNQTDQLFRLLWKHGFDGLIQIQKAAQKEQWQDGGSLQDEWQQYRLDQILLDTSHKPGSADYEQLNQALAPETTDRWEVRQFRTLLQREWQKARQQQALDWSMLGDRPLEENQSLFARLDLLEQAILFRLYVEQIPVDEDLNALNSLEYLIQFVARHSSVNRASRMALEVSRVYLQLQDLDAAWRFCALQYQLQPNYPDAPDFIGLKEWVLPALIHLDTAGSAGSDWAHLKTMPAFQGPYARLMQSIPGTFHASELQGFGAAIAGYNQRDARPWPASHSIDLALQLAKRKAIDRKDWFMTLDLDIWAWQLHQERSLQGTSRAAFLPRARELLQAVPPGQLFYSIVEDSRASWRFLWKDNKLQVNRFSDFDRRLQASMRLYLQNKNRPDPARWRGLTDAFRQVLGPQTGKVAYFWSNSIFAWLPMRYANQDRLLQVLSPIALLEESRAGNQLEPSAFQSGANRAVRLMDRLDPKIEPVSACPFDVDDPDDAFIRDRLGGMEAWLLHASRAASGEEAWIGHLVPDLNSCDLQKIRLSAKESRHGPLFVSRLELPAEWSDTEQFYKGLYDWLALQEVPWAVINLRLPDQLGHARFVQRFYDQTLALTPVDRRFILAWQSLENYQASQGAPSGSYRLVTRLFLHLEQPER
ncbi:MAG: PD40 domain-containing protein [Leptospiraceae bacterium]|nr:PD40 domain-containing protein [Leptospiraceae bacterium]